MYGMVNQGIQTFVCDNLGEETWQRILAAAELDVDSFETMLAYDDQITYRLVGAASSVLDLPASSILETFGDYWIDYASNTMIGKLLSFGGETLFENLYNLNELHERIKITLPHLRPPRFEFEESADGWHKLHYFSDRDGLQPMVIGLVKGLARACGEAIEIRLDKSRMDGAGHDVFMLRQVECGDRPAEVA